MKKYFASKYTPNMLQKIIFFSLILVSFTFKVDPIRCQRICKFSGQNSRMKMKPLCSNTGKYYDSNSDPSFACEKCQGKVEIDREGRYKVCLKKGKCVWNNWYSFC